MRKQIRTAILVSIAFHVIAFIIFALVVIYNSNMSIKEKLPVTFVKIQNTKFLKRNTPSRKVIPSGKMTQDQPQKQAIIRPSYSSSEFFYTDTPIMVEQAYSVYKGVKKDGLSMPNISQSLSLQKPKYMTKMTKVKFEETDMSEIHIQPNIVNGVDFVNEIEPKQALFNQSENLQKYGQLASKKMDSIMESTPSKQTMTTSEVLRVTGAANDPLRALQILPGITAPNGILAGLFIRGGGPEDNAYYFDRVYLSYPYHFSGLATTINSAVIESVDVFAGGFGAEFGNAQAIIDIQAKSPEREKFSFASDLNMLMSELMLGSPIGNKGTFYIAGRRSYADLVVPRFVDIPELTKFPQFWDYQTGFDYELTEKQKLHFGAFSANDSMEITLTEDSRFGDDEDEVDSDLIGKSHYIEGFGAQSLAMDSSFGDNLKLQSTLSHRTYTTDLDIGSGNYYFREKPVFYAIREDMDYEIGQRHKIQMGGLFESGVYNIESYFPRIPTAEEQADRDNSDNWDFDEDKFIRSDMSERFISRDGYLQDRIALADWFSLKLGTRASYFNKTGDVTIDPRASMSILFPNGVKFRSAYGIYHQNPTPAQILPKWGNPDVYASKATHYVMELERDIFHNDANIKVAYYYKDLKDLITEHAKDIYRNQGTGYAQGFEMLLKYHSSEKFLGWLSYTYSLSRRKDNPDAAWQLYIFDQTHVATLSTSYKPTPNWELGLRWNYASGTPIAPKIGDLRKPANHRLDLRFAKVFHIGKQPLLAYLDILNAYNYSGAISTSSNAQEYVDYQEQNVAMPVVPYLGVSMRF